MTNKTAEPPASLRQLVERSKLLSTSLDHRDLPVIERGIGQIGTQTRNIITKSLGWQDQDTANIKAHYLLTKGGVNTEAVVQDLYAIHGGHPTEYRQPILDTDAEASIQQKRTMTVLNAIDEGKQEILDDTEHEFDQELHTTLRNLRGKIRAAAGETDTNWSTAVLLKSKIDPKRIVAAGAWYDK